MTAEQMIDTLVKRLKDDLKTDYEIERYSEDYTITNANGAILIHKGGEAYSSLDNEQRGTVYDQETLVNKEYKIVVLSRELYEDLGLYTVADKVKKSLTRFFPDDGPFRFYLESITEPLYDENDGVWYVEMTMIKPGVEFIEDNVK